MRLRLEDCSERGSQACPPLYGLGTTPRADVLGPPTFQLVGGSAGNKTGSARLLARGPFPFPSSRAVFSFWKNPKFLKDGFTLCGPISQFH